MTGTDDTLAWEARQRPRGAIAAAIGALASLAAALFSEILFSDAPRAWFGESLGRAAAPGPLDDARSLQVPFFEYYTEHANTVLLGSIIPALGWAATGWAIYLLARATLHRRPELPKPILYLPIFAGVANALGLIIFAVSYRAEVADFLAGSRTVAAGEQVGSTALIGVSEYLTLAGTFSAALSFGLVSLNAMRVGLLTRFMGTLGILVGVLIVFPIGSPIPIVQSFWLAALAVLFLNRWPGGTPPAWRTGRAEPWPTTAELREQRMAAASKPAAKPGREPAAVPAGAQSPAAAARKRKRKRRS